DQALHDAGMLGADLGPAEEPVLFSHRDHAQGTLEMVRVHRHVGVAEEDLQAHAALAHIGQGLRQRVPWASRVPWLSSSRRGGRIAPLANLAEPWAPRTMETSPTRLPRERFSPTLQS